MDTERILELLEICDRTRQYPTLKVLFDEASKELHEMAKKIEDDLAKEKAAAAYQPQEAKSA